jgi:PPP family 3-phenylpropionic acid transporter
MPTPTSPTTAGSADGALRADYAWRVGVVYAAMFSVYGVALPYLNVWLAGRGLSIAEVALIATLGPVTRSVAGPIISFLADRRRAHRALLVGSAWASAAAWLALSQSQSFGWLVVFAVAVFATGAGLMPLLETITMRGVRALGVDYGRVRSIGSVTFIVAALASGFLVDWRGLEVVMALMVAGAFATAIAAHALPMTSPGATTGKEQRPLRLADALALLRHRAMLLFLAVAGLVQGSHALLNGFSVLHWQALGLSNRWCGTLWAIAVVAEIVLFYMAGRWFARFGALTLLGLGAGTATARWCLMAFDPPLALLVPLQAAHAFSFAASHLGAMYFLARAMPEAQAGTAQGLYSLTTGGIFMAIGMQIAGAAYTAYAGVAYLGMAVMAGAALAGVLVLAQIWNGGPLQVPRAEARQDEEMP